MPSPFCPSLLGSLLFRWSNPHCSFWLEDDVEEVASPCQSLALSALLVRQIPKGCLQVSKSILGRSLFREGEDTISIFQWHSAKKKEHKDSLLGPGDCRVGSGGLSSARRCGGQKVHSLPRKFVFLGFRGREPGMSRGFCQDVPEPWACSESLCTKRSKCSCCSPYSQASRKWLHVDYGREGCVYQISCNTFRGGPAALQEPYLQSTLGFAFFLGRTGSSFIYCLSCQSMSRILLPVFFFWGGGFNAWTIPPGTKLRPAENISWRVNFLREWTWLYSHSRECWKMIFFEICIRTFTPSLCIDIAAIFIHPRRQYMKIVLGELILGRKQENHSWWIIFLILCLVNLLSTSTQGPPPPHPLNEDPSRSGLGLSFCSFLPFSPRSSCFAVSCHCQKHVFPSFDWITLLKCLILMVGCFSSEKLVASVVKIPTMIVANLLCGRVLSERSLWLSLMPAGKPLALFNNNLCSLAGPNGQALEFSRTRFEEQQEWGQLVWEA